MTHRGRCIHFSSQAPRRSQLIASSSALALRARPPQLVAARSAPRLALRARPPQLVASSSALALRARLLGGSRCALARAARSPATARRTLLGARAARSPPRRLALRARPPQLVARSSALALRARLLSGSRCALARHGSSQAPPLEFAFSSARLAPRSIFLVRWPRLKFRASAELDRSSPWSLKQALMFGTSRRSSQLPWPPKPPHAHRVTTQLDSDVRADCLSRVGEVL